MKRPEDVLEQEFDRPWIGVDLDGTLAVHDWESESATHVGTPIPLMVARVRRMLAKGHRVKIMTARASERREALRKQIIWSIEDWCEEHLGARLEVTCEKDYRMLRLYDDRARQVVLNEGTLIGADEFDSTGDE